MSVFGRSLTVLCYTETIPNTRKYVIVQEPESYGIDVQATRFDKNGIFLYTKCIRYIKSVKSEVKV